MNKKREYIYNQAGFKVLTSPTKSYFTFAEEGALIELFIVYILSAEHGTSDEIRNRFVNHFSNEKHPLFNEITNFFKSDSSKEIFNSDTYETLFGQMAYTRLTDNALNYFKDVLAEVVRKRPETLKSNEKESLNYILSFINMESLVNDLTEKKIKKLFYGNISDIKKFFLDRLGINLFENEQDEKDFNQLIKQRNVIVHNRGIISEELAKEFADYKDLIGQRLLFKYDQLSTINQIINRIIVEIDLKLKDKFDLKEYESN